ncbi:MAG: hypothetical protein GVY16_08550 [Planctomycetes bacterium]|nr:hypothetical protein [Planctomycetota bacterium]
MTDVPDRRRFALAACMSLLVAAAGGASAAWFGRAGGGGTGAIILVPALLSGLAMVAWRLEPRRLHVAVLLLCGVVAAVAFGRVGPAASWEASQMDDTSLDALVLESVALRICFNRGVQGVQGYKDVPGAIRKEARRQVAAMSRQQRRALVDERFGVVINARPDASDGRLALAGWALAAGVLAATPLGILAMLRRSE